MIIKKKQGYGLAHKSNSCEYILCYNLVEIILLQENLSVTRTRLWRKTQTLLQTNQAQVRKKWNKREKPLSNA